MAIGMSYTEFWESDPRMVEAYYRAYEIRKDLINTEAWINGLYNCRAFSVVINNAFNSKKKLDYPNKPLELFEKKDSEEIKAEEERQKIIAQFSLLKANWDLTHKE